MESPVDQESNRTSPRRPWRLRRFRRLASAAVDDRSIGIIDGLDGTHLKGWYIGRVAGHEGNRFELRMDGRSLGFVDAVEPRPDVLAAEGALECGFSQDLRPFAEHLPGGLASMAGGRTHRFAMFSCAGSLVHEIALAGRPAIRGNLDRLDAEGMSGWAVDEFDPGRPVALDVLLDGEPWLEFRTSLPRKDLSVKGLQGDVAGFRLAWPTDLLPAGARVQVRVRASGEVLARGERTTATVERRQPVESICLANHREGRILPATVIVPIHDAHEAVAECLESLHRHLPRDAEALLVDDASSDPRIAVLLRRYQGLSGFRVHRNESNLGYTRTVNLGISLCAGRDVVLLNSDTVVTARWLENLRYAAYARSRVATVTPLSDNAGAFSVPEIGQANACPSHLDVVQRGRLAASAGPGRLLEVPTGNGFCMYVRRQALEALGGFDEARFPRGYGEENDFCMRALRAGWRHFVCDRAFVAHKRSQSFGEEKAALVEAGRRQLDARYPEYGALVRRFRDAEFSYLRHRVRRALDGDDPSAALPRVLYVISTQTGGTPQTNLDLMRAMEGHYCCLLLRCDARSLHLHELRDGELVELGHWSLAQAIEPVTHRSDEYDAIVLDILYRHAISLLHVRHVAWHGLGLAAAAKALGIPVVYSLHDFYSLCPSLNLLDDQLRHCGGRCTPGEGACQASLWKPDQLPPLKHAFVGRWREMFDGFMDGCDRLVTTTASAAALVAQAFPRQAGKLAVIAHGRDFAELSACARYPGRGARIRVLVPGNISPAKGAMLLARMAELDDEGRFEFHFLGNVWPGLDGVGVRHGPYRREEFAAKVAGIAPHLGVVLSVWPETWCHTLTEMWACGVPVLGVDVGAVGERIRASGAGWLVRRDPSARTVMDAMQAAVEDAAGYQARLRAVQDWQAGEAVCNDTRAMAIEYRRLYAPLLDAQPAGAGRRIGMLVKGDARHPPTAHIRVLRPLAAAARAAGHEVRTVDVGWLLAGGLARIDALVVQRDAVPAASMDSLLRAVEANDVPLLYEIDDLLWELPEDHGDHEIDLAQQGAIMSAIRAADVVVTATPALRERLARYNGCVRVVPNAPDPALWLSPLPRAQVEAIASAHGLRPGAPRILYMGTRSHAADLDLVAPAMEAFLATHPGFEVVQVGGGRLLPGAGELKVPREHADYPGFVAWFRAVASVATFALAPLRDTPFNAVKSDIKFLDYALAAVPAIYSASGPYGQSVTDGVHGLLAENDPRAWVAAMTRLAADASLRDRIRGEALRLARSRMLDATGEGAWERVLGELFGCLGADTRPDRRSAA
ncbi:MAG TPA: glycosyltransferase [Luteimonas sp.]|nr:glycosyltransferase [Luteimonas sp.]